MTQLLHVMISYKGLFRRSVGASAAFYDSDAALNLMSFVFKLNFEKVFNIVRTFESNKRDVVVGSISCKVENILLFESDKTRMNETEGDDFVIVLSLKLPSRLSATKAAQIAKVELSSLEAKEAILRNVGCSSLLNSLVSERPAHSFWISPAFAGDILSRHLSYIAAFYFYAWLLVIRIERDQVSLDISPTLSRIADTSDDIIRQRIRLINVERLFLTADRTNDDVLKDACSDLVRKWRIDERYERCSTRLAAFEHHMDNTSKALQAKRVSSLANTISLLTMLSIPLAAMQVLFGINFTSSIYADLPNILGSFQTYLVVLAAIAVLAVPMIFLRIIDHCKSKSLKR